MSGEGVRLACPVCGLPLPPIRFEAWLVEGSPDVVIEVSAMVTHTWLTTVKAAHPFCFGSRDDGPDEADFDWLVAA